MGLPVETEVLTTEGFKKIKDLKKGEYILTFNKEFDILEFQEVLWVTEKERRKLYTLESQFEMTSDNLVPTKFHARLKTFRDCMKKDKPTKIFKAAKLYSGYLDIEDDYLRLFVWLQRRRSSYISGNKLIIRVNNPEFRKRVIKILNALGCEYRQKDTARYGICLYVEDPYLVSLVKEYMVECKFTPKWIGLSMRQFEIFKEEFEFASMSSRNRYYTPDVEQLDIVATIYITHGESVSYEQERRKAKNGEYTERSYLRKARFSNGSWFNKNLLTEREGEAQSVITFNKFIFVKQYLQKKRKFGYVFSIVGGYELGDEIIV